MILYQLPSGKTISVSIDALLNLDKHTVHELSHSNVGKTITDPFDNDDVDDDDVDYVELDEDIPDTSIDFDEGIEL